jgi:hypothetical protein
MKTILLLCLFHVVLADKAMKMQTRAENSLNLIGRTQQFVDSLNEDTINYVKLLLRKGDEPIINGEFEGNFDNVEFDKLNPLQFMRVGHFTHRFKTIVNGKYLNCIPLGSQVIPSPPANSVSFFKIDVKRDTEYRDEQETLIAITGSGPKDCNGTNIYIPETEMSLLTIQNILNTYTKNEL